MDEELVEVTVNVVLAVLSLGAIFICRTLPLACLAFLTYFLAEVTAIVRYFRVHQVRSQRYQSSSDLRSRSTMIQAELSSVIRWTRPVYFPLLAAQFLLFAGVEVYLLPLAPPVLYLLLTELVGWDVDPVAEDLTALASALCVSYAAFLTRKLLGDVCALLNLAAFCRLGPEKFRNSFDHLMLVALGQLVAVQFFTDFVHDKNRDPLGILKYIYRQ